MLRAGAIFGIILLLWSCFTVGRFVRSVVSYVYHRSIGPPTFPGDPDIEAGIIFLTVILNIFMALS